MNHFSRIYWIIVLAGIFLSCSQSAKTNSTKSTDPAPGRYQVYLLLGQSNMAGRGPLTKEYLNIHHDRVFMLDKENKWVPAKHPLHFDKPKAAGVGPGFSFAEEIAKAYPNDTIGLVPCAVGGTPISKWEPGAFDKATQTYPYDDAIKRIREAKKKGTIKGAIWLQGEGDSNPASAALYLARITTLIERVRKEAGDPVLPFVAGELGRYRERYKLINDQLARLPQQVPFTSVVSSEGLTHKGDTTHFNSPSMVEYGKRFAKGMLQLQKKSSK